MTAPDNRKTADAVRDVRAVYPNATMTHNRNGSYDVYSSWTGTVRQFLGHGDTPKEAWWNARTRALEHALSR